MLLEVIYFDGKTYKERVGKRAMIASSGAKEVFLVVA